MQWLCSVPLTFFPIHILKRTNYIDVYILQNFCTNNGQVNGVKKEGYRDSECSVIHARRIGGSCKWGAYQEEKTKISGLVINLDPAAHKWVHSLHLWYLFWKYDKKWLSRGPAKSNSAYSERGSQSRHLCIDIHHPYLIVMTVIKHEHWVNAFFSASQRGVRPREYVEELLCSSQACLT